MKTSCSRTAFITLMLLVGVAHVADAQETKRITIKVGVSVEHDDKMTADEIESYVSRELRGLGDVEVVKSAAEIGVYIVAVGSDHIAMATTARREYHEEPFQRSMISVLVLNRDLSDAEWDGLHRFIGSQDVLGQWVTSVAHDRLQSSCQRLVASIDTDAIAPQRLRRAEFNSHPLNTNLDLCTHAKRFKQGQ